MAKVVIFGSGDIASLAHFYLKNDSPHEVVAFAVDEQAGPSVSNFEDLPVIHFDELDRQFPPQEVACFAPMSHHGMNRDRHLIYERIKARGYQLISYISSRTTFYPGLSIGDNCFILENNTIQPFAKIGSNVVIWSGNHIGHHAEIGDHVFIASHVVLPAHCIVEPHCFFGVNATVRNGVRIAEGTLVGMAAVVTHHTEPWSVYRGTPSQAADVSSREFDL
jgi:sugar O-acyltransferase (sialic acid O-acetyltransferase NeuD family)